MKLKLTGMRCQCTACGAYFNRVSTFDKHRIGDYSARSCLTSEQMEAKGWKPNTKGFWVTGAGGWRPQA